MDSVDPTPHLERFESYEQACREFRWLVPRRFNIAAAVCRRHPDAVTRVALTEAKEAGTNTYTFGGLDFLSDKFATVLSESGVEQGDSVAVLLPQSAALAVAHLGVLKMGAVVLPLSMSWDADSLEHALAHSNCKAAVMHESILGVIEKSARAMPDISSRFVVRDLRPGTRGSDKDFWTEVDRASSNFDCAQTDANWPAFIFYVGEKGKMTGIVHRHAALIGQLTAFETFTNLELDAAAVFWTPDDWSEVNRVLGMLYPAWWYGCSVVASGTQVHHNALRLIERGEVTHAFITSSQLRAFVETGSREGLELKLQAILSEGALSQETRDRTMRELGVTINEIYGKAETGLIAGGCERWFSTPPGSVGRAAPGHSIEIIDDNGHVLPANEIGRIAVHRSDPALFIEYLRGDRPLADFNGDWFLTGDFGHKNRDGDLYVQNIGC